MAIFAVLFGLGHLAHIVSGIIILLVFLLYRYIAKDKRLAYFSGFAIIAHLIIFSQLDTPKRRLINYPKNIMIVPAEYAIYSDQTRNPKSLYTASYVDNQVSNSNGGFRILKEMPSFTDDTNQVPPRHLVHQVSDKDSVVMNKKTIKEPVPKDLQEDKEEPKDTEGPIDRTNNIENGQKTSPDHETQKDSEDTSDSEQNTDETENTHQIKSKEVNINNIIASDLKKSFTSKKSSRTSKKENNKHADIKAPSLNKSSAVLVKNTHNRKHRKSLLSKGSKEDLIAAHKNDELEINKYKDRVGETVDPYNRKKSNQPKVKQKNIKGIEKNNLIVRSQKKKKKSRSRKRKKSYPDDYNHVKKSEWQRRFEAGKLTEINDDVRPLQVYKKGGWKDFSVDMSVRGKAPELSIKGHDELRHKNYMWHIVRKVGLKWFYRYAPIRQVLEGNMKPGRSIVVGFNLTPKGRMRNFRFITRGTNKVQQEAVQRTFRKMRFDPPPKGFKYRNLRVKFTITKPRYDKNRRMKIIWGKVYLSGQVKNLYE